VRRPLPFALPKGLRGIVAALALDNPVRGRRKLPSICQSDFGFRVLCNAVHVVVT